MSRFRNSPHPYTGPTRTSESQGTTNPLNPVSFRLRRSPRYRYRQGGPTSNHDTSPWARPDSPSSLLRAIAHQLIAYALKFVNAGGLGLALQTFSNEKRPRA